MCKLDRVGMQTAADSKLVPENFGAGCTESLKKMVHPKTGARR